MFFEERWIAIFFSVFLFLFSIFWCQVCSDHIKPVGKWFLLPYFLKDIGIGIIYLFCSWENSPMNPSRFDVFLTGRCVIANSIALVYTEPFFFYSLTCNHFLIIHCVNFDILHFFKEFVNFIYAVKFPGITLFVVFSFHLFKAYRVCRDILSLILGINTLEISLSFPFFFIYFFTYLFCSVLLGVDQVLLIFSKNQHFSLLISLFLSVFYCITFFYLSF